MRVFPVVLLLLWAATLSAQNAGLAPKPMGRITGTVFCNDTKLPARGALVSISPLPGSDGKVPESDQTVGWPGAFVSNDGSYTVEHLAPGTYAVFFVASGYLSGMGSAADLLGSLDEKADQSALMEGMRKLLRQQPTVTIRSTETETLNVTLERGASLNGQVHYPDGAPAAQVTLLVEPSSKPVPATDEQRIMEIATSNALGQFGNQAPHPDDRGRFRLAGLRPGTYRLVVLLPSRGSGRDAVQFGDNMGGIMPSPHSTRFYAGNTTHNSAATLFQLHGGEEVNGIDITIPLDLWHAVSGTVKSAEGHIVQALLTLTDTTDPHLNFIANTDDDGSFRFPQVPAGSYTLTCDKGTISHLEKPASGPENMSVAVYTSAFATATRSIVVTDADLAHIDFSLKEVPLPEALKTECLQQGRCRPSQPQ